MREMCKLILATLVKNIDKCKFFANKDKVHRILDFRMWYKFNERRFFRRLT